MQRTMYEVHSRVNFDGRVDVEVPLPAGSEVRVQVVVLDEAEEMRITDQLEEVRPRRRRVREEVPEVRRGRTSGGLQVLYTLAIVAGLGMAAYLYLIKFDDFSETELVALSPVWVITAVFGLYGFIAQQFILMMQNGEADSIPDAARLWTSPLGAWSYLALAMLTPFLLLKKWQNSFLVSVVATGFWAVLLVVFFVAVFPAL